MKVKLIIGTVIVVLIGASLYVYMGGNSAELVVEEKQIEQPESSIEERFDQAKALLIRHCATCMENSKKGLLQGIHAMESVIQDGFSAVEAKSLLANAYNQMWIVYAETPEEKKEWKEKKEYFLVEALKVYPFNNDLITQLARTIDSYPEKIKLYHKAFESSPKNTSAGYSLGVYLLEAGKKKEALDVFTKALLASEQGDTFTFGREMNQKLMIYGMDEEAKDINALVDQIFEERNKAKKL